MKTTLNHINEFEKELLIQAPWEAVEEEYGELLARYSKAPIRGFRGGRAPVGLVESTFRTELRSDLAASAGRRFCRTALQEHNLRTASGIAVSEVALEKGGSLSFKATFVVVPPFELPDYRNTVLLAGDDEQKRDEILERLLQDTEIALPNALIEEELRYTDQADAAQAREEARKRVAAMLILREIARVDAIEVDERDLDERIALLAEENGATPEQLKSYLRENGALERVADSLLAEQVLGYLIEISEQA